MNVKNEKERLSVLRYKHWWLMVRSEEALKILEAIRQRRRWLNGD